MRLRRLMLVGGGTLLIILVILGLMLRGETSDVKAYWAARYSVYAQVHDADTAVFEPAGAIRYVHPSPNSVTFDAYVDTQNSHGVKFRNRWVAKLHRNANGLAWVVDESYVIVPSIDATL